MAAADEFSFRLTLRHPSIDARDITTALSKQPTFAWTAHHGPSGVSMNSSRWHGLIATGSGESQYHAVLTTVREFIQEHEGFLVDFVRSGGEIELQIGHTVAGKADSDLKESDDERQKVFDMTLYPEFLRTLASIGIALNVVLWA